MSLLTYSGITTKVRAMQSHLLSEEQFHEMAGLEDVRSAADYLKQLPTYAEIFAGVDDSNLHRGHIEQLLTLSEYRDFAKLYRFSNLPQRRFLDLYFMHYEINIIKRILRHVMGHQEAVLDLSMFQEFFDRHSNIDLPALAQSENLEDFLSRLKGSPYYEFLSELASKETCTMFDLEMNLDLFYFRTQWKVKNKMLSREERHALEQCFGCRLDLLNIQWIYRARHYYHLSPSDIYALLIPVNYKLKPDQIRHLAKSADNEEFFSVLRETFYWKFQKGEITGKPDIETLYHQICNQIYANAGRRYPYSVAILDSYLYSKELELQKIITTLEGIRYRLDAGEIIALVEKQ